MIVGRVLREVAVGVQSLQSWGSWGRIRKNDAHHGAGPASIPSARVPSRAALHGFGFQVHRPVCIVGAGRRLDRFTFRFAGCSRLAAAAPPRSVDDMGKKTSRKTKSKTHRKVKISKSTSINQPVASFYPPPWRYQPQPQPVVNPQSRSSSSSDSDSGSSGCDSSTSSRDIKKQELQLHRGASLVMKLPKVCFRPAHVWPGHDTPGVTLRGPATSTRSSWELAWNGAMWVG